jgi:hypothetical protein
MANETAAEVNLLELPACQVCLVICWKELIVRGITWEFSTAHVIYHTCHNTPYLPVAAAADVPAA